MLFRSGPELKRLAESHKMKVPAFFGIKNKTRLAILDQGFEVAFRNLKIRPLVPQAVGTPAQPGRTVPNPLLIPGKGNK